MFCKRRWKMDVGPIKRREHRILNSYMPNQWIESHSLVLYLSLGPQTSLIKLLIYRFTCFYTDSCFHFLLQEKFTEKKNYFRFGRHFELPLLAQSIIMVFTMLALTEICVRVKHRSEILASKEHKFTGKLL